MLWWLAQNTLVAAALAGLVLLLARLGRLSPAARHALWLVVLLKLLSPAWLLWPWPLPDTGARFGATRLEPPRLTAPPPAPQPTATEPTPPAIADGGQESVQPLPRQQRATPVESRPAASSVTPAPRLEPSAPPAPAPEWRPDLLDPLVLPLWILGTAAVSLVQGTRIIRGQQRALRGRPAPPWIEERVADWASRIGVRSPRALVVPGTGSPCLWCLGRPQLLIPAALLDKLQADCWPGVLVHELAHLRRRDHWVARLELLAGCLWWWNPLFWYVRSQLHQNAELACDAWVIGVLPDGRRSYAETLIEVCRLSVAAAAPALGMGGGPRRAFQRRLTMILCERVPTRVPLLGLVAIGLLALAVLPGWSPAQKGDADKAAAAMPRPLPLEEALQKARADGKYQMLLRQFKVEKDYEAFKDYRDYGPRDLREYAGQTDLPKGYWVYVYPYWYIWRDLSASARPKRNWGPEQATGEPDTTEAGDIVTAWASLTQDDQDEWLLLEYAEPIVPRAVMVYETYNPGALVRVTVFKLDGTEVEVWKGKDPTSTDEAKGVSVIPFKVDFKINRVKLYIDSKDVPGWNEIDAVGLKDKDGKTHWATSADASSTYAQNQPLMPATLLPDRSAVSEARVRKLEEEVRQLRAQVEELKRMVMKKEKDK
jgi:beta-lactamase regulating signal transducer with metallopeptidase domain